MPGITFAGKVFAKSESVLSPRRGHAAGLCRTLQIDLIFSGLNHISHLHLLAGLREVGQRQSKCNRHRFRVLRLHQFHPWPLQLLQIRQGHQRHHFDAWNLGCRHQQVELTATSVPTSKITSHPESAAAPSPATAASVIPVVGRAADSSSLRLG